MVDGITNLRNDEILDANMWDGADLRIRLSHQNLRKLPRTNTVVFTIHASYYALSDLRCMPLVPKCLAQSIQSYSAEERLVRLQVA